MNNESILESTGVSKAFGSLQVVNGVSLRVAAGEFLCIVGKSGSGKTTLLSLLSGLELPTSGRVSLNGKEITAMSENELALFRRDNVGFVFQSFHLIPTEKRRSRALELLDQMEMTPRAEHLPAALSGREKQRVAIARALVNRPKILFADEPTGNLDSATGKAIMDILIHLNGEKEMSLLMVTHDLELAESADQIVRMQDGEVI